MNTILASAPSLFQLSTNKILRDLLNHYVTVYIIDMLVYSQSKEEHVQHIKKVLTHLLNQLYVKAEKCEFYTTATNTFLGYNISQKGVKIDQTKVKASQIGQFPKLSRNYKDFLLTTHSRWSQNIIN